MYDIDLHDYAHCNQESCPKKDTCFRYWLYQRDQEIEHEQHIQTYCSYLIINAQEALTCTSYLPNNRI